MFDSITKFFKKPSDKKKDIPSEKLAEGIKKRTDKLVDFFSSNLDAIKEEYSTIKNKWDNLLETNYDLGLKHIEKGKLSEAIFRFRFIKRIWPDSLRSHYYLAYALALRGKSKDLFEAKEILENLTKTNPGAVSKAQELLEHINQTIENPSNA